MNLVFKKIWPMWILYVIVKDGLISIWHYWNEVHFIISIKLMNIGKTSHNVLLMRFCMPMYYLGFCI
jgi:hypothetical protein